MVLDCIESRSLTVFHTLKFSSRNDMSTIFSRGGDQDLFQLEVYYQISRVSSLISNGTIVLLRNAIFIGVH